MLPGVINNHHLRQESNLTQITNNSSNTSTSSTINTITSEGVIANTKDEFIINALRSIEAITETLVLNPTANVQIIKIIQDVTDL